jgi:O-antigen ligase
VLVGVATLWKGGKSLEITWLLPLLAAWLSLDAWLLPDRRALPSRLTLCLGGFLALSLASFAVSTTQNYGLDELVRDVSLGIIFVSLLRWPVQRRNALTERLLLALVWLTLIACAVGLVIYVLQPVNRFVGTFFDPRFHTDYWPNAWAQFLLFAWPALVWWATKRRAASWVAVSVVLGALWLSYSRGATLVFGGQLALAILIGALHITRRQWSLAQGQRTLVIVGSVAAGSCLLFLGANALRAPLHDVVDAGAKWRFAAAEGTSSITERADFWAQAWQLTRERPWLGWGPYSFRFVQQPLQTDVLATSDHPHNLWLKLSSERGLPAALLFTVVLIACLAPRILQLLKGQALLPSDALLLGVCGVLAHSLIDYNLQFVGLALPFWLSLALLHPAASTAQQRRPWGQALLCACLLLLATREAAYLVTSSLGRRAEVRGHLNEAKSWYRVSGGQWFSRDLSLSLATLALEAGDLQEAKQALSRANARAGIDGRVSLLMARLREAEGDIDAAARGYRLAERRLGLSTLEPLLAWQQLHRQFPTSVRPPDEELLHERLELFRAAFARNAHFVTLSPAVSDLEALCAELRQDTWRRWCADVVPEVRAHADALQRTSSARRQGGLW